MMLISEFSRVAGLTPDTVRFYVRLGLLVPGRSSKGGRSPYTIFTDEHVRVAQDIRLGQMLGLSLKQMVALKKEEEANGPSPARNREIALMLLSRLEKKAAQLSATASWVRASIEWEDNGQNGPRPEMPSICLD